MKQGHIKRGEESPQGSPLQNVEKILTLTSVQAATVSLTPIEIYYVTRRHLTSQSAVLILSNVNFVLPLF